MKKLEEKSSTLSKLEQDFQSLNDTCNEKDKQIKELQDIINLSENKLKNITTAKVFFLYFLKRLSTVNRVYASYILIHYCILIIIA